MLADDYPDLENFMTTWFNDAYDFEDLGGILSQMIRLKVFDNLVCLSKEIKRLESENITLAEVNEFFRSIRVRRLTEKRYSEFKRKIIVAAAHVSPDFN